MLSVCFLSLFLLPSLFCIHSSHPPLSSHALLLTSPAHHWSLTSIQDTSSSSSEQQFNIHIPSVSHMPGLVTSHLRETSPPLIPDPYFGDNDVLLRWIYLNDWEYGVEFELPNSNYSDSNSESMKKWYLVFAGIDTIVEKNGLRLNGHSPSSDSAAVVLDNMFIRQYVDVTDLIVASNTPNQQKLTIRLSSAIRESSARSSAYPYTVPASNGPSAVTHGEPNRNFIRKEQCSFSWDWGPCFPVIGIWRDAWIVGVSQLIPFWIRDVTVSVGGGGGKSSDGGEKFWVETWVEMECVVDENEEKDKEGDSEAGFCEEKIVVEIEEMGVSVQETVKVKSGIQVVKVLVPEVQVTEQDLWWPAGFGNQRLFDLKVSFVRLGEVSEKKIGFRTVELIRDPIGKEEESFYFRVNGVPIFAKGSNMIPIDAFDDRITSEDLHRLLKSARDANMNFIRVWGGGIYQPDEFYDLCDSYGLLVWQEFMFACSLYPTNDEFLESVNTEVRQQVWRLKHHASLALWSGSNENEASLWGLTWYPWAVNAQNKPLYAIDYATLYFDTVHVAVLEEDPIRAADLFWPSSPSNGPISTDPYQGRWTDPQSVLQGDVHYYNYVEKCTDVSFFPKAKFASEYGWQSFPSFSSLSHISTLGNWSIQSELMLHRQHHPLGTVQLLSQLNRFFRTPEFSDKTRTFKAQLYLTQVLQVLCIKAETEYYRSLKQEAHTMGAFYWQLNSIWQAPTWSSLEYSGRWKLLHFAVRDFFAPIASVTYENAHNLSIFIVDDLYDQTTHNLNVSFSVRSWANGGYPISNASYVVKTRYLDSLKILDDSTEGFLRLHGCPGAIDCFLTIEIVRDGLVVHENVHTFTPLKDVFLEDPQIQMDVGKCERRSCPISLVVRGKSVAPYVYLDVDVEGTFSDNGFWMYPNQSYAVEFVAFGDLDPLQFAKTLEVLSIRDTYSTLGKK